MPTHEGSDVRLKSKGRPRSENWTQFDRELIIAAKGNLIVRLYFSIEAIIRNDFLEAQIEVVDKYMLKLKPLSDDKYGLWIQKHLLAGMVVEK